MAFRCSASFCIHLHRSLALGVASCTTHIATDRVTGQRPGKLALCCALSKELSPFLKTLGHLIFSHCERLEMQQYSAHSFFAVSSTFYIRTESNLQAMCRVHGARSVNLGGQPVGHRKEPKTRKSAWAMSKEAKQAVFTPLSVSLVLRGFERAPKSVSRA